MQLKESESLFTCETISFEKSFYVVVAFQQAKHFSVPNNSESNILIFLF